VSVKHAQGELLAQVRPAVTTPVLAFTAGELRVEITLILGAIDPAAVLTTAGELNIAMYYDDDGSSTADQTTLIVSETRLQLLQLNTIFQAQHPGSGIFMRKGSQLYVQTDNVNDITFSIFGIPETLAEAPVRGR
jgi:hypothetical protein